MWAEAKPDPFRYAEQMTIILFLGRMYTKEIRLQGTQTIYV